MSGGANLLAITLEVISRRDTICEGEKMARERKRTIHETKGRTTARWLGKSREHGNKRRGGKMGPLLPASGEARRGGIYTQVQGTRDKYDMRKVSGRGPGENRKNV